jgi:hypothetical protein
LDLIKKGLTADKGFGIFIGLFCVVGPFKPPGKNVLTDSGKYYSLKRFDAMLFDNSDETSLKRLLSEEATSN